MKASVSHTQNSSSSPRLEQQPSGQAHYFHDNRPEAIQLKEMKDMMCSSVATATQRKAIDESLSSAKPTPKFNGTGMPDTLKNGLESLAGIDLADIKVHYNSGKPAQLGAHAYAQGTDIHIASGQEKYLPHETWHVVQQKQGRVRATTLINGGIGINDDPVLEKEADAMGEKALACGQVPAALLSDHAAPHSQKIQRKEAQQLSQPAQAVVVEDSSTDLAPGQMTKSEFLRQLYLSIRDTGLSVYKGTNLTVDGCPYIERWFALYRLKDSFHVEAAIRKYASAGAVTSALELIDKVCSRARVAFEEQVKTGRITGLPEDVSEEEGKGVVPTPDMIIQRKPMDAGHASLTKSFGIAAHGVIQRGCISGGGGAPAPAAPPTQIISDGHIPNWQFMPPGNNTTLQTSPMGDCWALIIVTPAGGRILAHLPAGSADQLNSGGLAAINALIAPGSVVTIVRGLVNAGNSAYFTNLQYGTLAGCALPAGPAQTLPGFFMYASVNAAGVVNTW